MKSGKKSFSFKERSFNMKKISVIFTGGTISTLACDGIMDLEQSKKFELIEKYKKTDKNIEFETEKPYFILSENLSGEHFAKLYVCVKKALETDCDGIIITHGTDTLQYSASAIDVMLGKPNKPIVFVSSNYPLQNQKANGFDNFVGAARFIKQINDGGVFVSYKNSGENLKIHTAENLLEHNCYSDELKSINNNFYGEFSENNVFSKNPCFNENKKYTSFENVKISKKSPVLRLKCCPGMDYPSIDGKKCVVIETYHSGTLKTDDGEFFEFVYKAESLNIPIVLTGLSNGDIYESAKSIAENKNIIMSKYSPIYTYIKCWILAENGLDIKANL